MRRKPFALPHAEQVPALVAVLSGRGRVAPDAPDELVAAAIAHRVIGACTAALSERRLLLPGRAAGRLRHAQAVVVLRSALLRRELVAIADALGHAIEAAPIVLKGPAIADRFYRDPSLRSFADLDLLVPRGRLPEAIEALAAFGYREQVELREGFAAHHGHDVHMARELGRQRAHVELHWRVGDDALGEALSHERLVDRSEAAARAGPTRCPAPDDQLLVCSMHLLSDRLKRLAWIEDIRRVSIALDETAWARMFVRARDLGLLWVLHRALDYADHHLGYRRARPLGAGEPPPWGPLRAVEELDVRASVHIGRLAALPWRGRARYLRDVLVPTSEGLRGTVGGDGAGELRLVARHLARAVRGLGPRR